MATEEFYLTSMRLSVCFIRYNITLKPKQEFDFLSPKGVAVCM